MATTSLRPSAVHTASLRDRYYDRFRRETANPDEADDLTQTLWLRLLEWQSRYGQPLNWEAFLYQCHLGVKVDWLRRKQRQARTISGDKDRPAEQADLAPHADEALAQDEWRHAVRLELANATTTDRDRLLLAHPDAPAAVLAARLRTTAASIRTSRCKLYARLRHNRRLHRLFFDTDG